MKQLMLVRSEIEVKNKSLTIDYLTKQLMSDNTQKIVNHCAAPPALGCGAHFFFALAS